MSAAMRSLSLTNAAVQGSNNNGGFIVIPSLQLGSRRQSEPGLALTRWWPSRLLQT